MKKLFLIAVVISFSLSPIFAQNDSTLVDSSAVEAEEKDKRPVRAPFESGYLIDNQTTQVPTAKTLEFVMLHRFGRMGNGFDDLWGIYGASNIKLAFNYTPFEDFQVGFGTMKFDRVFDFSAKYALIKQTRSNSTPFSMTLYGNVGLDSRDKETFGSDYKFTHRLSYFSQLIFSYKINFNFSIQIAPSFSHYNMTDTLFEHDKIGISFSGRARVTPTMSVIVNYDYPLPIDGIREYISDENDPLGNFGLGLEISTSTHAFQIFAGNSNGMLPQKNMMFNRNRYFVIGFNITRLWGF
ncbi:MAG: hypothetical protein C0593_00050 [Marinilabiliales bacterium]|nr:MAG: hypothetical protein C0593_00050 [Marinilabiliales bacterium]